MSKFLRFNTTTTGKMLVKAESLSGIMEIISPAGMYLLFSENNSAASSKVLIVTSGGSLSADEQATRNVITNAIERLFQAGYTQSYVDVEFPGVIIDSVTLVD
jgi:hypothetical protein|tara:strand:+ start:955 stop:1263 length:309 start_codon:yes stop_codon:yes gene_type:complete